MEDSQSKIKLPEGLWLAIGAVIILLVMAVGFILSLVEDMSHKIEWFKVLGAFGTPIVVAFGLWFTKGALEVNRGMLEQTRKTVENATEAQLDELFRDACKLIAESSSEIGKVSGLSILENIASRSDRLYRACIDVVCGFIRAESVQLPSLEVEPDPPNMSTSLFTAWSIIVNRRGHIGDDLEGNVPLNLQNTKLYNFETNRSDFCGARFRGAQFRSCTFILSRFAYSEQYDAYWHNVSFFDCDFRSMEFNSGSRVELPIVFFMNQNRRFATQRCISSLNTETGVEELRRVPEVHPPSVRELIEGIVRPPNDLKSRLTFALLESQPTQNDESEVST